jgi:hypothetical protein
MCLDGCTSLEIAPKLPETLEYADSLFLGCTNLKQAPIIPVNVGYMGLMFYDCINLEGTVLIESEVVGSIVLGNSETGFDYAFYNTVNPITVKVPRGSMTYKKLVKTKERDGFDNITILEYDVE